jgi:arylsulfatase A-like enzyme
MLIVLDATRVDHCSCYGASQPLTPALDQLAENGLRFEHAYANAPWTLPAMSSILTGLYPTQMGIEATRVLDPSHQTLATLLSAHGYSTFAISKNSWFSTEFGLPHGFDVFHKLWQLLQTETDLTEVNLAQAFPAEQNLLISAAKGAMRGNVLKNAVNLASRRVKMLNDSDYGARRTLGPVKKWISARQGPWFALVHYLEAHLEYKPPVEWARRFSENWPLTQKLLAADQLRLCYRHITGVERLSPEELQAWRQLYAAEVAYQDHAMGQLLDWLNEAGHLDNTLIIVVADHGESMDEHGLLAHLYSLHDPLIHVPLVMHGPDIARGQTIGGLVETRDIFGTVLAAAGVPLPGHSHNLLDTAAIRQHIVAEYGLPRTPRQELLDRFNLQANDFAPFLRSLTAVRTERQKLVTASDGALALYDLVSDPSELVDLADQQPERRAELLGMLGQWQASVGLTPATPRVDVARPVVAPEIAERLKALGYLD